MIPKHSKLSDSQKEKLLEKYNISIKELPRILKTDPAIISLDTKAGDVIRITRKSGQLAFLYQHKYRVQRKEISHKASPAPLIIVLP